MATWNLTFYARGGITVDADAKEDVEQMFMNMTDEELYKNVDTCDIIEIWKEDEEHGSF